MRNPQGGGSYVSECLVIPEVPGQCLKGMDAPWGQCLPGVPRGVNLVSIDLTRHLERYVTPLYRLQNQLNSGVNLMGRSDIMNPHTPDISGTHTGHLEHPYRTFLRRIRG